MVICQKFIGASLGFPLGIQMEHNDNVMFQQRARAHKHFWVMNVGACFSSTHTYDFLLTNSRFESKLQSETCIQWLLFSS